MFLFSIYINYSMYTNIIIVMLTCIFYMISFLVNNNNKELLSREVEGKGPYETRQPVIFTKVPIPAVLSAR